MQPVANEPSDSLAKKFAWLLRSDIQKAYASDQEVGFEEWWLLKGRQEFPGWASELSQAQIDLLFSDIGTAAMAGLDVPIPKFIAMLTSFRADAVKELSQNGKLQAELFFAWAVVKGLSEHRLLSQVPVKFLVSMDKPLPATLANATPDAPAATVLMYLVWSLMDEKTKATYNLFNSNSRQAFFKWFFPVAKALGITPLLAGRWRAWLLSPVEMQQANWLVPRFCQLAWQSSEPMRQKFKLESSQDFDKLSQWSGTALVSDPVWNWLQKNKPSPVPATLPTKRPFGVNLYGFAFGELGIGEDLRMAVACCEAANIPYHVVNVQAGKDLRQADTLLAGKVSDLGAAQLPPYATNVFCLPAFDMVSRIYMQKGQSVFEGYHNIGWWPWEMAVFPKAWAPYAFQLVQEVWASSEFLLNMYKRATSKPVKLMPLSVSVGRSQRFSRAHFGLPDHKYLFLFVFDFNSSTARKNPQALLQAFQQAFSPQDPSVGLVIKVMNVKGLNPEWQQLLAKFKADPRVHLLSQTLDRPEALGLIQACDAYVSLHRAEGFGRTLAEAMLFGKPVVATNYSGNVDFMNPELTYPVNYNLVPVPAGAYQWVSPEDGASWAEVDVAHAAQQMKKAKNESNLNLGAQIQNFALGQFAPEALGVQMKHKLTTSI